MFYITAINYFVNFLKNCLFIKKIKSWLSKCCLKWYHSKDLHTATNSNTWHHIIYCPYNMDEAWNKAGLNFKKNSNIYLCAKYHAKYRVFKFKLTVYKKQTVWKSISLQLKWNIGGKKSIWVDFTKFLSQINDFAIKLFRGSCHFFKFFLHWKFSHVFWIYRWFFLYIAPEELNCKGFSNVQKDTSVKGHRHIASWF